MKSRPLVFAFLACLLAASPALADEKSYSIKYHRKAESGDVFEMHSTISLKRTPTGKTKMEDLHQPSGAQKGEDPEESGVDAVGELKAKMEVHAVDSNGSPKEFTLTIKFLKRGDDTLMSDDKINVKRTADGVEYTEGQGEDTSAVDEDNARFLNYFFEKLGDADATDDDIFRSNKPRKIGDKWEADYDALENMAKGENLDLDIKGCSLFAKLLAVQPKGKSNDLVVAIEGKLKFKKVALQPHLEFTEAVSQVSGEFVVAEDKSVKSHQQKMELAFEIKAKRVSDDRVVTFKDLVKRSSTMTLVSK